MGTGAGRCRCVGGEVENQGAVKVTLAMVIANMPLRRDAPSWSQGVEDRQGVGHAGIASSNEAGPEWV
eukprot:11192283-Lingulodinium_polyedra.AAC.1